MTEDSALAWETVTEREMVVEKRTAQATVVALKVEASTVATTDLEKDREQGPELELELEREEEDQELGLGVEDLEMEHQAQAPGQELDQGLNLVPALETAVEKARVLV
jgi:hypothetical protein